jgi:hypothetical protein
LIEVGQPVARLLNRVHDAVKLHLHAPLRLQHSGAHNLRDGRICSSIFIEYLMQRTDLDPAPTFAQPKTPVSGCGPQIDQYSIWLEDALRLVQGMNHALNGHSSEGPGENHRVELIICVLQPFRMTDMVGNATAISSREAAPRLSYTARIRIESFDVARAEGGQAKGQPAVPAADLEYAAGMPVGSLLQRADLIPSWIDDNWHGASYSRSG